MSQVYWSWSDYDGLHMYITEEVLDMKMENVINLQAFLWLGNRMTKSKNLRYFK